MARDNRLQEDTYDVFFMKKMYQLEEGSEWYEREVKVGQFLKGIGETGMRVDSAVLTAEKGNMAGKMVELQNAVEELAGRSVKIGSTPDLGKLLFDEKGLKPLIKTASGKRSVADTVLSYYEGNPLVDLVRKWKTTRATLSYLETFGNQVRDGRIHYTFLPYSCPTGRIYTRDMNIQSIPPAGRKAIVPDVGKKFVYVDYNQMEFRILLSIAEEKEKFGFVERGGDIHVQTIAEVLCKSTNDVTPEERAMGKTLNYAISYGIGSKLLGISLKKTEQEAATLIKRFFETYSKVALWKERIVKAAKVEKYAQTIFGHKRDLVPDFKTDASSALRMAVNTQIQGASSGFLKMALDNLSEHKKWLRVCCCVHDSILMEVAEDHPEQAAEGIIRNCVCFARRGWLPLEVDLKWGKSWAAVAHPEK